MTAKTNSATRLTYSVDEAAVIAGVSSTTIRAAIKNAGYPYALIARRMGASGGRIRIEHDELVSWIHAHPAEVAEK